MPLTLIPGPTKNSAWVDFDNNGPVDLPTSLGTEIGQDCFVEQVEIVNASGAARIVQVYDNQSPAKPLVPPHALADTEVLTYTHPCRRMTGGLQWSANGAGCTGTVKGRLKL